MNSLPRLPPVAPIALWRSVLEAALAFLPMVLLAMVLWASVWLVRNAPQALQTPIAALPSHEPDYFAREKKQKRGEE